MATIIDVSPAYATPKGVLHVVDLNGTRVKARVAFNCRSWSIEGLGMPRTSYEVNSLNGRPLGRITDNNVSWTEGRSVEFAIHGVGTFPFAPEEAAAWPTEPDVFTRVSE